MIANYHGGLINNQRLKQGWYAIHDDLFIYTYDPPHDENNDMII
jgi:hypothetical protein